MKNFISIIIIISLSIIFSSCSNIKKSNEINNNIKNNEITMKNLENAYFAGGCFWCMEGIFESQEGVKEVFTGYIGGSKKTATYNQVATGNTYHREGIKIIYDPKIINYEKLTELFWTQIDPTDPNGQFADKGFQYTTAMYYSNNEEKNILEKSKKNLENSNQFDKKIVTKILPFETFFKAEEYHQDYYKKSSLKYKAYKKLSGRSNFIEKNWEEKIKNLENDKKNLEKNEEKNLDGKKNFNNNEKKSEKLYKDYSEENLENATQKNIVLFFHADWCPTCNAFEKKVLTEKIPEDILILKVNYDKELELRKKYNIVTQTSFILIDKEGNLKKRWIGGRGIDSVISKIGEIKDVKNISKIYTKEELKSRLTPLQYKVTQEGGTEPPFDNKYWDNHEEGIYIDIIDRTPLFSSTDKFDSGTGWPSFTKPIDENFIKKESDYKLLIKRTEIKSDKSHLGHVFEDGPKDKGGLRYCINSAALDFIPKDELKGTEYEKYLELFK